MCRIIEEFDVTPTEFWTAVGYVTRLGQANEVGLLVPGARRRDLPRRRHGREGAPRRAGGRHAAHHRRTALHHGCAAGEGRGAARPGPRGGRGAVRRRPGQGHQGTPVPGAIVDVWHANTKGFYSFFDPTPTPQSPYNLRRRIETDAEGRYRFRTIMPSGYGCPPDGPTQQLLDGARPARQAPRARPLLRGGAGLPEADHADQHRGRPVPARRLRFRHPRRLIPELVRHTDPAEIKARGLNEPFATITFDFELNREAANLPDAVVVREHAKAA